jgi:Zn-dependent protease
MNRSIRIGRLLGIPIEISYTWFIIFAVVTASLAGAYFPGRYPGWDTPSYWTIGLFTSLLFFGSVLTHELAHSLVAMAWGIPVRSIMLFVFGGVASIEREPDRPLAEFLIAVAGPIASLVLGLVFGLLWLAGRGLDLVSLEAVGLYLGGINVSLAVFNLLPGFPLDGGRIFRSIAWAVTHDVGRATRWAAGSGRVIAWLIIAGGGALLVMGNWASGIWLGVVGWFLDTAAHQSGQQARLREALKGYTALDFASSGCQRVDGNLPLDWAMRDRAPTDQLCFVVMDGLWEGPPAGLVTAKEIRQVPMQRWGWTSLRQIMTPLRHVTPVSAGEAAYSVLERMANEGQSLLPVIDNGEFLGLVQEDSLLRFATLKRR